MNFSNIFGPRKPSTQLQITQDHPLQPSTPTPDNSVPSGAISTYPELSGAIQSEINFAQTWCLPTQAAWLHDDWPLKIWEKSRQVTATDRVTFLGETEDSHCDRFWAKALRQEATRHQFEVGAQVG